MKKEIFVFICSLFFSDLCGQNLDDLIQLYNADKKAKVSLNNEFESFDFINFEPEENGTKKYQVGFNSDGNSQFVNFSIEEIDLIFDRLSKDLKIYSIKEIEYSDTIFNQGFIVSFDSSIYYVSFQNQSDWNKYDQFNFKTKGSIFKVNSISLLNEQLKTLYTFHYNNKKLLYISRFIYENDKFIKIVINVTSDRDLDIDDSFKLDKIKKFLEVNDNIFPLSIIFPNIHPNYVCYSWLLEDNYMNELFIKPIFEKVYKAIND